MSETEEPLTLEYLKALIEHQDERNDRQRYAIDKLRIDTAQDRARIDDLVIRSTSAAEGLVLLSNELDVSQDEIARILLLLQPPAPTKFRNYLLEPWHHNSYWNKAFALDARFEHWGFKRPGLNGWPTGAGMNPVILVRPERCYNGRNPWLPKDQWLKVYFTPTTWGGADTAKRCADATDDLMPKLIHYANGVPLKWFDMAGSNRDNNVCGVAYDDTVLKDILDIEWQPVSFCVRNGVRRLTGTSSRVRDFGVDSLINGGFLTGLGSQGGSRLAAYGGAITDHEVLRGWFNHAFKLCVNTRDQFANPQGVYENAKTFPAFDADTPGWNNYGQGKYRPTNVSSYAKMGCRSRPGVTEDDLPHATDAAMFFLTPWRNRGAFVADGTQAQDAFYVSMDYTAEALFKQKFGFDIRTVVGQIQNPAHQAFVEDFNMILDSLEIQTNFGPEDLTRVTARVADDLDPCAPYSAELPTPAT